MVICAAIAALDENLFKNLLKDSSPIFAFLKDPTLYNDFLRVFIIKWFVQDLIELGDLNRYEPYDEECVEMNHFEQQMISADCVLKTLNGYCWKATDNSNKNRKKTIVRKSVRASERDIKAMPYKYVCAGEKCQAAFVCSKVKQVGVKKPYRLLKYLSEHTCINKPNSKYNHVHFNVERNSVEIVAKNNMPIIPEVHSDTIDTISDEANHGENPVLFVSNNNMPLIPGPKYPILYCFNESMKMRCKYDIFSWKHGSNYRGVTSYKCVFSTCKAQRFIWICKKNCKWNETKDVRCCKSLENCNYS